MRNTPANRQQDIHSGELVEIEVERPGTITSSSVGVDQTHETWSLGSLPARINGTLAVLLLALEALLGTRFLLAVFGANRSSGFVDFVRDVSWPFVRPFANAFRNRTWDQGIIELDTVLAMGVWLVLYLIVAAIVTALVPRTETGGERFIRRRVNHV